MRSHSKYEPALQGTFLGINITSTTLGHGSWGPIQAATDLNIAIAYLYQNLTVPLSSFGTDSHRDA